MRPTPDSGGGQIALCPAPGTRLELGPIEVVRLAVAAPDDGDDLDVGRWQRRRTRMVGLELRLDAATLTEAARARRAALTAAGATEVTVRLGDDCVSVTAKVADGLASADVSMQAVLVGRGRLLRLLIGGIRVHGHLPTPSPLIAERLVAALVGGTTEGSDGLRAIGLLEYELDLANLIGWRLLPPAG